MNRSGLAPHAGDERDRTLRAHKRRYARVRGRRCPLLIPEPAQSSDQDAAKPAVVSKLADQDNIRDPIPFHGAAMGNGFVGAVECLLHFGGREAGSLAKVSPHAGRRIPDSEFEALERFAGGDDPVFRAFNRDFDVSSRNGSPTPDRSAAAPASRRASSSPGRSS